MNNILLIFLKDLKEIDCFENIVNDFKEHGYQLYLYDDINNDDFMYTDILEIIQYYQNMEGGVNKVVVLSNIRDLTFFWYRCYNQIIDDFVYIVEEEEVNYFDVDDRYFNVYYNIFEFNNIDKETIEGKIYLTKRCNTILPIFYNPKYFQLYKYFDFNRICYKSVFNKEYDLIEYTFDFKIFDTNNKEKITIDKINSRIVCFKGGSSYDVLRILMDYNVDYFKKLGFDTDVIDLLDTKMDILNEKLINKKADFIFSMNCIGVDFTISDGRNLYDAIDTPFLGTLGDHPVKHSDRIMSSPKKMLFTCLDEENVEYFDKYFPDKKIITNYDLAYKSVNYTEKIFQEREIDIVFVGTIVEPESLKTTWNQYRPLYRMIINEVCDKILNNDKMLNIDHELEQYYVKYDCDDNIRLYLHATIERYIRNYKRYHLVKKLGESGLRVLCIGNKDIYNKLNISGNLLIYENVDFQKLLDIFNNSKILINITGHLYYGVTERILSAMLNGAVVVTEGDLFASSNFSNNKNIILYQFNQLDDLIEQIKYYLKNLDQLQEIALNGQHIAKKYDFRNKAATYARLIRNFDSNFNKEISTSKIYFPDINHYKKYINLIYDNRNSQKSGKLERLLKLRLSECLGVNNILLIPNLQIALQIAYRLLDIKGDIITTPLNAITTLRSIEWNDLNPIYADISMNTLNIDVEDCERKITNETSCIITNHLYGNGADVEKIKEVATKYNLKIIYDCTHAFDVSYKNESILNQGNISFVDLGASHCFGAIEGAVLIINDNDLYDKALRYISSDNFKNDSWVDVNARMDDFQSAMALSILNDLDKIKVKKEMIFKIYKDNLSTLINISIPKHNPNCNNNYSYYPIIFNSIEDLVRIQEVLEQNNIITESYMFPSLIQTFHSNSFSNRTLCLPINEDMTDHDVFKIIDIIKSQLG